MKIFHFLGIQILSLLLLPCVSFGQGTVQNNIIVEDEVKIGIALSAGGAKGFAHIGVLKVLEEENIPVHIVTGSSMGAVIGGLYAAGYAPDQIQEIAMNTDWQALFNDNLKPSSRDLGTFMSTRDTYLLSFPIIDGLPQLPAGLVRGQNLSMLLYRLLLPYHDVRDFSKLPKSFASVATNLATGEPHRFDSGYLPEAIRASAAIPSIFKPVTIDGVQYIDGGVIRSIPAEDARAIGADIVLVSDVGEPVKPIEDLDTFVDILFQSVGFHQVKSDSAQIRLADFYLRPEIKEYNSFSYEAVQALIEAGEQAAREMLPEIRAALDTLKIANIPESPGIRRMEEDIVVNKIEYHDIEKRLLQQVKIILDMKPPQTVTYKDIEQKINKLYATGYFGLISFRINGEDSVSRGKTLTISFSDDEPDRLGFSMRYDSRYKASLLFGLQLRNVFTWGDQLTSDLRLGEILGVSSRFRAPLLLKPSLSFVSDLDVHRTPLDYFVFNQQLATFELNRLSITPGLSVKFFENVTFKTGVRAEFYRLNEAIGDILGLANEQFLLNGIASLEFNNLNRPYFPTRGLRFRLQAETSSRQFLSEATFSQVMGNLQFALPLFDGVDLFSHVMGGHSTTSNLPFHYRFFQGGLSVNPLFEMRQGPLWGYSVQQLNGSSLASIRSGLQFHLGEDFYLQGGWNGVHVSESVSWYPKDFEWDYGFGLSLGGVTLIGPVNFSLSTPDFKNNYAFKVDVGYSF